MKRIGGSAGLALTLFCAFFSALFILFIPIGAICQLFVC